MKLKGKTAIVTGASVGLGAAIAERFAAEGASLFLCARNSVDLDRQRTQLSKLHGGIIVYTAAADVAKKDDVDRLFAAAANAFPKIDILVNNAGVYGPMGAIDQIDWDEWEHAIAINLLGTVYCARKAAQMFKPNRSGKIINLSGGGATNPLPGISAYAASKAAIVRFTETLALELSEYRIDVNAVAPGALATRLTDQLLAAGPEKIGEVLHSRMTKVKADGGTPLKVGADLCVYLASTESDGITGRLISAPWDPWPFTNEIKNDIKSSDIYTLRRIVPSDRGKSWNGK
jgi:NAD(P)-dependent dehydrogenase (short-subunit alcohol dehydrogenase family)